MACMMHVNYNYDDGVEAGFFIKKKKKKKILPNLDILVDLYSRAPNIHYHTSTCNLG